MPKKMTSKRIKPILQDIDHWVAEGERRDEGDSLLTDSLREAGSIIRAQMKGKRTAEARFRRVLADLENIRDDQMDDFGVFLYEVMTAMLRTRPMASHHPTAMAGKMEMAAAAKKLAESIYDIPERNQIFQEAYARWPESNEGGSETDFAADFIRDGLVFQAKQIHGIMVPKRLEPLLMEELGEMVYAGLT